MSNVISEKQQKNTLRGKKAKKGAVKNVLASPYTHYWPLLKNEDNNNLKQILKDNLPILKQKTKGIPWEEIKDLPKEQRKDYRKKNINITNKSIDPTSKYMYLGINEVTKLLEKDEAISVLLNNDAPKLLTQHIVDMCVSKRVPVLAVPDLKSFLFEVIGFPATVIAFRKNIPHDSKEYLIHEAVIKIFLLYPVPENHRAFPECYFFNSTKATKEKELITTEKLVESLCLSTDPNNAISTAKDIIKSEKSLGSVYLYRDTNKTGRVFIPKGLTENAISKVVNMEADSTGFLSFGNGAIDDNSVIGTIYRSLVVKQVKSNPDRNKRKLDIIKYKGKKQKVESPIL